MQDPASLCSPKGRGRNEAGQAVEHSLLLGHQGAPISRTKTTVFYFSFLFFFPVASSRLTLCLAASRGTRGPVVPQDFGKEPQGTGTKEAEHCGRQSPDVPGMVPFRSPGLQPPWPGLQPWLCLSPAF